MSALDVLKSLTVSSPFFADNETAHQRLTICRACPSYSQGQCKECGCVLMIKTKFAAEKCPLKKW